MVKHSTLILHNIIHVQVQLHTHGNICHAAESSVDFFAFERLDYQTGQIYAAISQLFFSSFSHITIEYLHGIQ